MPDQILYAYAIVSADEIPDDDLPDPVPGALDVRPVVLAPWAMIVSAVDRADYSQDAIDEHSEDLEWLGSVGWGHQRVNSALAAAGDVIPLRAFTLFSDETSVAAWLTENTALIEEVRRRTAGRLEWTVRLDSSGTRWIDTSAIRELEREIETAPAGKAYLLRKKLERELDRSRDEKENEMVAQVASRIEAETGGTTLVETRTDRGGGDPQIDVLFERSRSDELERALERIADDLEPLEVGVTLSGPWPPYSFTGSLR